MQIQQCSTCYVCRCRSIYSVCRFFVWIRCSIVIRPQSSRDSDIGQTDRQTNGQTNHTLFSFYDEIRVGRIVSLISFVLTFGWRKQTNRSCCMLLPLGLAHYLLNGLSSLSCIRFCFRRYILPCLHLEYVTHEAMCLLIQLFRALAHSLLSLTYFRM